MSLLLGKKVIFSLSFNYFPDCICSNISALSPQEQFANVFLESNLLKLANLAAVLGFQPWSSPTFWVLGVIDITFLYAIYTMFRKSKSKAPRASVSTWDQKLQRRSIYLVGFMVKFLVDFFYLKKISL